MDKNRVSKIYTTLLRIHNTKPSLWIMAAKFEFEMNESIETSRQLFQRALRFLPQSKKLWIEVFLIKWVLNRIYSAFYFSILKWNCFA
jgi:U3 small nucleolar RNA-associated protein 6